MARSKANAGKPRKPPLVPGSVEEVVGNLARWGARPPWGLALVVFDNEFARKRAVGLLAARLKERGVAYHTIELPPQRPAEETVRYLWERLKECPSGVVSVEGLATAFPDEREQSLIDSLRPLNYNRERLAFMPVRQIWWMPRWFADLMQYAIPDLSSWFMLRLRLTDDNSGKLPRPPIKGETAKRKEAVRLSKELAAKAEQALTLGESPETVDRDFIAPAAEALKAAGADHEAAELSRRFAVRFAESAVRLDDMNSLAKLAKAYEAQARYADAEPLCRRILDHHLRYFGREHPATAASLNDLGYMYHSQGRFAEAEPLLRRALEIRESTLGPNNPNSAQSLNNLARLYEDQGRSEEAEPLYHRALESYLHCLGPTHPETVLGLNNLGNLYRTLGRWAEAEPLLHLALYIREQTLRPDDPKTATSLNNLAELYSEQGRWVEAEPLHRRALDIRERVLGPDHPDTAATINNLAICYEYQGRQAMAEPLLRRALEISERRLGPDHPNTAKSLNNIADLYKTQGRWTEAESLHRRALEIRERVLGPDHPDTANSLNNLASLYHAQGRRAEAEPLYRRALEICEARLGAEHPDTKLVRENLEQCRAERAAGAE